MILGGDELGRTQSGNNNAYCQDNDISWYHWDTVDLELLEFTQQLIRLRKSSPALRPAWFRQAPSDDVTDWVQLLRSDGNDFSDQDWDNPEVRSVTFVVGQKDGDAFVLLLNSAENGVEFAIPKAPNSEWTLAASSDAEQKVVSPVTTLIVRDASFTLLRSFGSFDISGEDGHCPRHRSRPDTLSVAERCSARRVGV